MKCKTKKTKNNSIPKTTGRKISKPKKKKKKCQIGLINNITCELLLSKICAVMGRLL